MPKAETFDPNNEEAYKAEPLACHACATRDRKAHERSLNRTEYEPPDPGIYYRVFRDEE